MPWVALEKGASLHRCRDARCSAFKVVVKNGRRASCLG
jgi:hypothetical protein